MTGPVPEYIASLKNYVPGKPIEETQREYGLRKVIKLGSNENPLGASPQVRSVIRGAWKGIHRYPDASGYRLKAALSQHLGCKTSELILGNGSNELIDLWIRTFCQPGDALVTHQGAFVCYQLCGQIHGVRTHAAPLNADLHFEVDEILELARKDPRVKLIFLANPNNPTGTYFKELELVRLLQGIRVIRDGSIQLVLDYAYWEYVTAPDLPDPHPLLAQYPNLVILRTFSKIYGLAALRVGYAVASESLLGYVEKVRQPFNLNSFGLAAAEVALADQAFLKKCRDLNTQEKQRWEDRLHQASIPFWPSQGNFILVDTLRGLGQTGQEVYEKCLREGVILRPVVNYGMPHALRISVGTVAENNRAWSALLKTKSGIKRGSLRDKDLGQWTVGS